MLRPPRHSRDLYGRVEHEPQSRLHGPDHYLRYLDSRRHDRGAARTVMTICVLGAALQPASALLPQISLQAMANDPAPRPPTAQ